MSSIITGEILFRCVFVGRNNNIIFNIFKKWVGRSLFFADTLKNIFVDASVCLFPNMLSFLRATRKFFLRTSAIKIVFNEIKNNFWGKRKFFSEISPTPGGCGKIPPTVGYTLSSYFECKKCLKLPNNIISTLKSV